jgi:hypothetical protein
MTARAMSVMQGMNLQEALTAEEGALAQQLERLQAELQAATSGQPSPAAAAAAAAGEQQQPGTGRKRR